MPSPFVFLILIFAAYRLTRLAGWDDFPLAVKIRGWVIGQRWIAEEPIGRITEIEETEDGLKVTGKLDSPFTESQLEPVGRGLFDRAALPGKQPPSEVQGVRPAYDRPVLAHLIHCPFCVGFWISLATWLAWLSWHPVVYGLAPFAISGAVGLVAKNLDP